MDLNRMASFGIAVAESIEEARQRARQTGGVGELCTNATRGMMRFIFLAYPFSYFLGPDK